MKKGPLSGVKIVDVSSILMVPYCTRILADLGADVIKIETLEGDITRYIGPSVNKGMGAIFLNLNRNKKSISVNLKTKDGKVIIQKLISKSDVFVSNIRKSALRRLGFTHKNFLKYNSSIITAVAVGFSSKGPYSDLPAFDDTIQACSGMASYQEAYSNYPSYTSGATADKATGLMLGLSIVSALYKREKEGKGFEVEVPMFETMVDFTLVEHLYGYNFIPPKAPPIYPRQSSPSRKPYKTKDGYIAVLPYNDDQWIRFLKIIGKENILNENKFSTLESRNENVDELYDILAIALLSDNTKNWINKLRKNDIPAMKMNKPQELFEDVHLKETNFFKEMNHPSEGRLMYTKLPIYFDNEELKEDKQAAPTLGKDNVKILKKLGYKNSDILKLIENGVLCTNNLKGD